MTIIKRELGLDRDFIAYHFRKGDSIEVMQKIDKTNTKLKDGDEGIITEVDENGFIHVDWDRGFSDYVIPEVDIFMTTHNRDN